jgi:uncharacterized repeat protein (TIGR03803 family)
MRTLISAAVFAAMSAKPEPRNGGRSLMQWEPRRNSRSRQRESEAVHVVGRVLNIILAGSLSAGLFAPLVCAASEGVVYSFQGGSDGAIPQAGLITNLTDRLFGRSGTLYGTTSQGGGAGCTNNRGQPGLGCGTVFEVTPNGVESVLYSFAGGSDGALPSGNLINVGGTLYGTTNQGGGTGCGSVGAVGPGCGTVFKVTPLGVESVLHSFQGGTDGANPSAGLVNVGGTLYGTTFGGGGAGCGGSGCGTVFKVTPKGVETVLHSFQGGSDGSSPLAGLVNVGGTLYGTTQLGGSGTGCIGGAGCGTVFKITPLGVEHVIYSFVGGSDGAFPQGRLINVGGTLYGTTSYGGGTGCPSGGNNGCGTVFKVTHLGVEHVLHSFAGGNDGANPNGGLLNVGGTLYGATNGDGTGTGCGEINCGTVFKVTLLGVESVLYSFQGGSDGANPNGDLINVGGTLYGTTSYGGGTGCPSGGNNGCGTVFKVPIGVR